LDKVIGPFLCYRGLAAPREIIDLWRSNKYIRLDGYASSSLNEITARKFALYAETDEKDMVLFKIRMQNETGKHYIALDRNDYTLYPEEQEILL
jgi:hypothetical protein